MSSPESAEREAQLRRKNRILSNAEDRLKKIEGIQQRRGAPPSPASVLLGDSHSGKDDENNIMECDSHDAGLQNEPQNQQEEPIPQIPTTVTDKSSQSTSTSCTDIANTPISYQACRIQACFIIFTIILGIGIWFSRKFIKLYFEVSVWPPFIGLHLLHLTVTFFRCFDSILLYVPSTAATFLDILSKTVTNMAISKQLAYSLGLVLMSLYSVGSYLFCIVTCEWLYQLLVTSSLTSTTSRS